MATIRSPVLKPDASAELPRATLVTKAVDSYGLPVKIPITKMETGVYLLDRQPDK